VLSLEEEAIVVAFRKHTLLPLDDCLYKFICKRWTIEPETFYLNPIHQMPGLNTLVIKTPFSLYRG
jgi:hypothetical protein